MNYSYKMAEHTCSNTRKYPLKNYSYFPKGNSWQRQPLQLLLNNKRQTRSHRWHGFCSFGPGCRCWKRQEQQWLLNHRPLRWPSGQGVSPESWRSKVPIQLVVGNFPGSSHTSALKIDTPVATLPGAWRYRVSAGTGWPGVIILWLSEMES